MRYGCLYCMLFITTVYDILRLSSKSKLKNMFKLKEVLNSFKMTKHLKLAGNVLLRLKESHIYFEQEATKDYISGNNELYRIYNRYSLSSTRISLLTPHYQ